MLTEHRRSRRSPVRDHGLSGSIRPRVATRRPPGRSYGTEAIRFARDELGLEPLGWQEWVLRAGLVRRDWRWASRTVGVMVGRQNGKTSLATIRALAGMVKFGEKRILAAAQNRDVALEAWHEALRVAEAAELGVTKVSRRTGSEEFWIGEARYKVVSSTRRGARGLGADLVLCDELREYRDWDGWAALEKTRRARQSSQLWALSSEGDEGSLVLASMSAAGRLAAESGVVTDAAWFEWSAAPDLERTDPRGWVAANPALGRLITAETIASEARHDAPEVFETEVLCRRVVTLHPWLGEGMWMGCADQRASVPEGAEVVFALDAGPEMRHATVAAGWERPDGRTHVEAIGGFPDLAAAADELADLVDRWRVRGVVVAAKSAAEAAARRVLRGVEVPIVALHGGDLLRAQNAMTEAVAARSVVHPGDPLVATHVAAVTSEGTMTRRSTHADIDAAVAVVLAHHGVATIEAVVPQDWVAF